MSSFWCFPFSPTCLKKVNPHKVCSGLSLVSSLGEIVKWLGRKCLWPSHCFSLLPPHPREAIASFTMVPTPLLMSLFNRNSLSSPNCLLNLKGWLCCVVPLEPTKSQLLNALGAQITGVFWYPEECLLWSCIRGKQKQQQKHEQCHSQARRMAADRILVFSEG